METKNGAAVAPSYEDFEPFCQWRHDDGSQTLVVHLPAFRKEQLKVQITRLRTLKISGERLVDATKRSRFYKEITVPRDCNAKEIHAKFVGGLLSIIMPKEAPSAPKQEQPPQLQQPQAGEKSTTEISQDQVPKLPTALTQTGSGTEKILLPNNATLPGNISPTNNESQPDSTLKSLSLNATLPENIAPTSNESHRVSRLKSLSKMAMNMAVVVVVAACLGAYIMYSYRSLYAED